MRIVKSNKYTQLFSLSEAKELCSMDLLYDFYVRGAGKSWHVSFKVLGVDGECSLKTQRGSNYRTWADVRFLFEFLSVEFGVVSGNFKIEGSYEK